MNILFASDEAPMSSNFNGAASYKFSHLRLLLEVYPNARFTILTMHTGNYPGFKESDQSGLDELNKHYSSRQFTFVKLDLTKHLASRKERQHKILSSAFERLAFFYPLVSEYNIEQVREIIRVTAPNLIWTEQLVENYLVLRSNPKVPVVYSQTDFIWKIRQLRQSRFSIKKAFLNRIFKKAESALINQNRYLVSGSLSEIKEVRELNSDIQTSFLPTAYDSQPLRSREQPFVPRLMHLGTLRATANRVGLIRFLKVCWPELQGEIPDLQLHVVGSLDAVGIEEIKSLLDQPGIYIHGFVEDLTKVLLPYDFHIIPYEFNTGTRTRLSLALNFNQVLISTRNASMGIDGLVDRDNCILVDSLQQMTSAIVQLIMAGIDYREIVDNGKCLFEKEFTISAQKERMASFLEKIKKTH